jgi:glutathione S-transferase
MIKLLGRKNSSNVQKVVFLLEELGEPYEREDYGRQFGNTTTPDYLKLNPTAKVPTRANHRCYAADPLQRADIEHWMDWLLATLNPLFLYMFRNAAKPAAERPADFAAQVEEIAASLTILDGALAGRSWLCGDQITIADIAFGPMMKRVLGFPIDLPALPNLRAWQGRIEARPAFQKATAA